MPSAEDLDVEDVYVVLTESFGLEGEVFGEELVCLCPVHEAGESGHKPSCGINLVTGLANCWSCSFAGDLLDVGVVVLGGMDWDRKKKDWKKWSKARAQVRKQLVPGDIESYAAQISRRARLAIKNERQGAVSPRHKGASTKVQIPSLNNYSFKLTDDLARRDFSERTLRRWDVRFAREVTLFKDDGKTFTLTHAIAIPIFNPSKELKGYCYRATDKSDSWFRNVRYIYTPQIQDTLSHLWFGMHLHKNEPEITVVEGALDAMWCDQNVIPAVAILGSQVKQLDKIRGLMNFRKVTLMTDRDNAGGMTAYSLGTALAERGVSVWVARYSRIFKNRNGEIAKDANDLCPMDLELAHARAVPFAVWRGTLRADSGQDV